MIQNIIKMWDLYYLYPYFDLILHYSKKIRDTKGIFHAKMGLKKDRNDMDLTEAENIKKRWQEYTEELYQKRASRPR